MAFKNHTVLRGKVLQEILDKIKSTNYQFTLLINDSKLNKNFFPLQKTKEEIENFTHDDLINDWIIERVRRFNFSSSYLIDSINNAIAIQQSLFNHDFKAIEPFIRKELRNICINIEMYTDKIIAFCKYFFYFDAKKTKKNNIFISTLKQFVPLTTLINDFLIKCSEIYTNESINYINSIRNDEIHNESPLDLHIYHFDDARAKEGLFIIDNGYKINTKDLFSKVHQCICLLIELKSILQQILETIHPLKVVSFISQNKLRNIIEPKIRTKIRRIGE